MRNLLQSFLDTRWVLVVTLLVFTVFAIPHLYYPFYCDEAWVYAPAVKTMAINGPSLLPGVLPENFSRGHPLLFHFLGGLWIKCFGNSNFAVHSFPFVVTLLFLVSLYECCRSLFNTRVGTLALLLGATQVLFFVQSTFVFPEIMVALFALLSLFFYVQNRFVLAALALFGLFFAKESGLVFGMIVGIDSVITFFRRSEPLRRRSMRVLCVLVPVLLIGLFFQLQKAKMGWYVLPLHTSLVHTDWDYFYAMFREGLFWTFRGDCGNYLLAFFALLLSVVAAARTKNLRNLFLFLPVAIVFILTNKYITEHTGDVLWMVLFVLFLGAAVYYIFILNLLMKAPAKRFIILLVAGFTAYLVFLSFSQPSYRYLLADIAFYIVFLAVCIHTFAEAAGKNMYYLSVAGVLAIGAFGFYADEGNNDSDLESFHAMNVQRNVIAFLEQEHANDKEIITGCYWVIGHFTDTMQGFVNAREVFTKVKHIDVNPGTDYIVFDNICSDYGRESAMKSPDFHLAFRTEESRSWSEVYKRN